jgi:hypothetical protein
VRLGRLTRGRPGADLEIGWLVEFAADEPLLAGNRLADLQPIDFTHAQELIIVRW